MQVVCILDVDNVVQPNFFSKLQWLALSEDIAIVNTPQRSYNINPAADIFGAEQAAKYGVDVPGRDAWGLPCCNGTGFMVRARAFANVGWFIPTTVVR